jgi:hypothetical protein
VEGLTDVKEINESIKIGNGDSMKATKIGNLKFEVTQINGEKLTITLNDVKYVPSHCVNATDGCVTGVLMKPILSDNINGFANASISTERSFDINCLHKLVEHCGQEILNNTIKMYGFKSSGSFDTCEQCAIAKARQKNVNKN